MDGECEGGQLSPHLQKIAHINVEYVANGDAQAEKELGEWVAGLTVGKASLKTWRGFVKFQKHDVLMSLAGTLRAFSLFLSSVDIDPHPSLELLLAKCTFYETAAEQHSIGAALKEFMDNSWPHLQARAKPTSNREAVVDPEVWTRDIVFHALAILLKSIPVDELDDRTPLLIEDLKRVEGVIEDDDELTPLRIDLRNVASMLSLSPDSTCFSAVQIKEAVAAVGSALLARLADFMNSPGGVHLIATAKELLQRRAGDDIATQK